MGLIEEVDAIIDGLYELWKEGKGNRDCQKDVLQSFGCKKEAPIGIARRKYAYDSFKEGVACEMIWKRLVSTSFLLTRGRAIIDDHQAERILDIMPKLQYGLVKKTVRAAVVIVSIGNATKSPIPEEEAGGVREIQEMEPIVTVPIYHATLSGR